MGAFGTHGYPSHGSNLDARRSDQDDRRACTMSAFVGPLSATCIILTFALLLYWEHKSKKEMPMREIAGRAASAGGFVPALFLMYSSFNISALCNRSGSSAPLALGGACLFYLSFKGAFKRDDSA
jgi:hypothetical protein